MAETFGARSAADIKRQAKAREALHATGERWHRTMKHKGTYQDCPQQTCYRTHRLVSQ